MTEIFRARNTTFEEALDRTFWLRADIRDLMIGELVGRLWGDLELLPHFYTQAPMRGETATETTCDCTTSGNRTSPSTPTGLTIPTSTSMTTTSVWDSRPPTKAA